MDSQKADNQLNLALDLPEEIRQDSPELNLGFNKTKKSWELIIRYVGNLDRVTKELDAQVTILFNNYAIVVIEEDLIPKLEAFEEIIFIEKPRMINFGVVNAIPASCIPPAQRPPYNLSGKGVTVAIIDSGIDYSHPDFRNEDGTTRIRYLWDQTIQGNPPPGYFNGTLYTREEINEALSQPTKPEQLRLVPSTDLSGHGTHVAGICCGNGRASKGVYRGVAFESDIIVVKLGASLGNSFPSTVQLMEGINYIVQVGLELNIPIAINISFGNSYGAHAGNSLLESYIDSVAEIGRTSISIGTGNEGASGRHYQGTIVNEEIYSIELAVAEREQNLNVQLWSYPYDRFEISIISPQGKRIGPINRTLGSQQFELENSTIYLYYGEPTPFSVAQEAFFVWIPNERFITSGIWMFELNPIDIRVGNFYMWLPSGGATLNKDTKFVRPSVETTLTIPSTSNFPISVGAYDSNTDSIAYFSGRGYTINQQVKPDLVAPGVNITSTSPGGGYSSMSGTSMATPFVTGSAALLMQWGVVENHDPYLYGNKVKAYLLTTARPLRVYTDYPNPALGFGALCLRNI